MWQAGAKPAWVAMAGFGTLPGCTKGVGQEKMSVPELADTGSMLAVFPLPWDFSQGRRGIIFVMIHLSKFLLCSGSGSS